MFRLQEENVKAQVGLRQARLVLDRKKVDLEASEQELVNTVLENVMWYITVRIS